MIIWSKDLLLAASSLFNVHFLLSLFTPPLCISVLCCCSWVASLTSNVCSLEWASNLVWYLDVSDTSPLFLLHVTVGCGSPVTMALKNANFPRGDKNNPLIVFSIGVNAIFGICMMISDRFFHNLLSDERPRHCPDTFQLMQ